MSKKEAQLKTPRGCSDWLPEQTRHADWIIEKAKEISTLYGFRTYQTPIFESTSVFTKTLGDTTDIVTKEMYCFEDRNGDSFTLRPEGTAPLVRLFLNQNLSRSLPMKALYYGPMFRYERPQKGRQRQFHQIGVEHLGAPASKQTHFETLLMAWQWLKSLNIEAPLRLHINGIGDLKERTDYKNSLIDYLKPHLETLSEESRERLVKNPLRILDSKSQEDKQLLEKAPRIIDFISSEKVKSLEELVFKCEEFKIPVVLDHQLVRGLDYYNDLVFEFKAESDLGAQNTVLAGGRYDNLVSSMGGASTEAIGWAAGVERLMILSKPVFSSHPKVGVLLHESQEDIEIDLAYRLRNEGVEVFVPKGGNFSKRLQKIQKKDCTHALIYGEEEIKNQTWTVKDLSNGEQKSYKPEEFLNSLGS